jgi:hypothetical protein
VAIKKKQDDRRNSNSGDRLEEFFLISKIHQIEASAAKDRQLTMKAIQEMYGSNDR